MSSDNAGDGCASTGVPVRPGVLHTHRVTYFRTRFVATWSDHPGQLPVRQPLGQEIGKALGLRLRDDLQAPRPDLALDRCASS